MSEGPERPVTISEGLSVDPANTVDCIAESIRHSVASTLRRRGLVLGLSGGVDSSVCAALAVRALGPSRVFALLMPESESPPGDAQRAREWADSLGIECMLEDITPMLEGAGCYRRRDEAIRSVVPEYGPSWRCKVVLDDERLESNRLTVFYLVVEDPAGSRQRVRLPPTTYREIVAATNFKQRVRKILEYYHADRLHYAVLGTPNRLEYDQGFFVKGGDGLADLKPIAHLYKSQVYQLAEFLGVPEAVTGPAPTTGTFSLPQTQEEFFFSLPLREMDAALWAHDHGVKPQRVAMELGRPIAQIEGVYRDIERKRSTTRYLHLQGLLVEPVAGLG